MTRWCVTALVLLLTVAALAVGIPWGRYRYNHIVVSEAVVKGTVTKIGARIEGRVKSIEVEAGQRVSKGEVLLRLEDTHLRAALERTRGELECATRDYSSEKMGIEQSRRKLSLESERANALRSKAGGELDAQKSTLAKLENDYNRYTDLLKKGAASVAEMDKVTGDRDKARGLVDAASGVVEAAESNYQKALNELDGLRVRESRLGVLDSQISVARAKVAAAEADVEATMIKAPEDGRVLERIVGLGGSAKVGEPLISLWLGRPWIEAWTDERDLRKIKIGSPVDISLDASPRRRLTGRVEAIGLATDKQIQPAAVPSTLHAFVRPNAMVPLRIALEEDSSRMQLGLSVLVGIRKDSAEPEADARPLLSRLPSLVSKASSTN
jgi:membrane fusion protein (multidrug efflux system)